MAWAQTAKALWLIYLALTAACGGAYYLAGMEAFDAVGHAFSTVAIGGFSTHDESLGFFQSPAVESVAIVFMVLSGVNFSLHFLAVRGRGLRPYREDAEFAGYIWFLCGVSLLVVLGLYAFGHFTISDALRQGIFHVVSIATTTGFTTTDFYNWPGSLPFLLVQEVVWGFFAAYVAVFVFIIALLLTAGLDHVTAFSAAVASMNNLGPGLSEVGANYATLGDFPLLVLSFAMLMGRLEIFTLLVLFTPAFWRR